MIPPKILKRSRLLSSINGELVQRVHGFPRELRRVLILIRVANLEMAYILGIEDILLAFYKQQFWAIRFARQHSQDFQIRTGLYSGVL